MTTRPWLMMPLLVLLVPFAWAQDGFVPLVKSDDPKQFELVGIGPDTVTIQDGVVSVSGKPNGYFATKQSYRNYVLRFDWKYERPEGLESDAKFRGNSGLLIHINGPDKVWPKCVEVQLANSDAGNIFAIFGAKFRGKKDPEAQKRAVKPVGQWNEEEVTCRDGKITCTINGVEVATGTGADPDGGRIGWQSEGSLIRFRNVKIRTLD
jgi:hypothetical protein